MNNLAQLELFENTLPARMWSADPGETPRYRLRDLALTKARIDPNQLKSQNHLIVSLARHDSWREHLDGFLPPPTLLVTNNDTGTTDLLFTLRKGVYWSAADTPATRYLGHVQHGLKTIFRARMDHAGKLVKNPRREDIHFVEGWAGDSYTLDQLAAFGPTRPRLDADAPGRGLGRDCGLFVQLAHWSWRNRGEFDDQAQWDNALQANAWAFNFHYDIPLPQLEVDRHVQRVFEWSWARKNFLCFTDWQTRGRVKANAKQATRAEVLATAIRAFKAEHPTLSERAIGERFKVGKGTVYRALRDF